MPATSGPRPARVLIADDHTLVRQGVRLILDLERDLEVVAEAGDGVTALQVARCRPEIDLAVVDIAMPRMTGVESVREMARARPDLRFVMLSDDDDERWFFASVRAGASAYVLKSAAEGDLVAACRAALRGEPYVDSRAASALLRDWLARDVGDEPPERLTHREQQVVKLIAEAYTTRQIADALTVSVKTVEGHRANVLEKLGVRDRVEVTRYAIRRGLVDP